MAESNPGSSESVYPEPVVVPLDFIELQSKSSREDLEIDESGVYLMSKALEEFMRHLLREATQHASKDLEYDGIAEFIAKSEFRALQEFFPKRVAYGEIADAAASKSPSPSPF